MNPIKIINPTRLIINPIKTINPTRVILDFIKPYQNNITYACDNRSYKTWGSYSNYRPYACFFVKYYPIFDVVLIYKKWSRSSYYSTTNIFLQNTSGRLLL